METSRCVYCPHRYIIGRNRKIDGQLKHGDDQEILTRQKRGLRVASLVSNYRMGKARRSTTWLYKQKPKKFFDKLDHPHYCSTLWGCKDRKFRSSLVLESLSTGGPILNRMPFKEVVVSNIVWQIMSAVSYTYAYEQEYRTSGYWNVRTLWSESKMKIQTYEIDWFW